MLLDFIFILLTIYLFILFFIPETETTLLKNFSIWVSSFVLIFSTYLLINFQLNTFYFQNLTSFNLGSSVFNIQFFFAVDGISILFIFFRAAIIIGFFYIRYFTFLYFFWSNFNSNVFFNWDLRFTRKKN